MSKSGVRQVYNDLDPAIVEAANVKLFQHKLQAVVLCILVQLMVGNAF